jgi:glycosyltransferase involved in cell wall biosynthesis
MSNILYIPQLSMYDKQTKKLIPEADGNINMMRNTILEWQKNRPSDNFYVLLPSELSNTNKMRAILPDGTKKCYPIFYDNYVVSARINRFNFPMDEFSSLIIKDIKMDLVINDIIELTGNFKQMFKIQFNYEPKIISNIRHLDDNINYSYMYRVIDGIMQSDLVTILSETMKNNIYGQLEDLTNYNLANELFNKIIVFEPSISYNELSKYKAYKGNDKVIITFPGRLAKGEERRTNWDKFIEAILLLREKRQDFEVYFTDPNNSLNNEIIEQKEWTKTIKKDRDTFLDLLAQTDIIVSLMDVEGFGGISIREALLFDCLPVIPKKDEYKKMAQKDYPGFINSPIDVTDLVGALEWAIIKSVMVKKIKRRYIWNKPIDFRDYGKQFTIEEQFKNILPKIEEML